MKFEFDTTNDGATEAAALAAALATLYGTGIADAFDKADERLTSAEMDRFTDAIVSGAAEATNVPKRFLDPRASDGHPVETEQSAADAFADPGKPQWAGKANPDISVTLDTAGIPWDERIHASTKTANKDGTWTRRRNTPDETFDAVMAELKGAPPAPPAPPAPGANAAEAFANPTPSEVPAPPATAGPTTEASNAGPTVTTAASLSDEPITFSKFVVKTTKAQAAGLITKDEVLAYCAQFDVGSLQALNSAGADKLQAVNALVDAHING